jgi:hypothetical protein
MFSVTGGPLTSAYDTRAQLGGQEAAVDLIVRTDCAPCDTCREEAECTGCFPCTDCDATCETCIESLSLEVPSLPSGPADLVVINAYGSSSPIPVTILRTDTGLSDSAMVGLFDSADSGAINCPEIGDLHTPNADLPSEVSCKKQQNLYNNNTAKSLTIRERLSRVLDRMRSVMY